MTQEQLKAEGIPIDTEKLAGLLSKRIEELESQIRELQNQSFHYQVTASELRAETYRLRSRGEAIWHRGYDRGRYDHASTYYQLQCPQPPITKDETLQEFGFLPRLPERSHYQHELDNGRPPGM